MAVMREFKSATSFENGIKAVAVALFAVFLSACSGEPSNEDMRQALQRSVEGVNNMTSSLFGPGTQVEILAVQKLGCESQERGYLCEIEIESKVPIIGLQRETRRVRFVEGEDSWVATD